MSDAVIIEHATKTYGEYTVLRDISCAFERGKIHGLIGRNGSGKTVLLKAICGFVPLTSGQITVFGKVIGKDTDVAQKTGVIIEAPGFLPECSAFRNLRFLADIRGKIPNQRIREVLSMVGLADTGKKPVGHFSLGMRQRLGIAQALMDGPELLLLDEPFNGLDNEVAADMRDLLLVQRANGVTIVLASHNPLDIMSLCDTICEMDAGRLEPVSGQVAWFAQECADLSVSHSKLGNK